MIFLSLSIIPSLYIIFDNYHKNINQIYFYLDYYITIHLWLLNILCILIVYFIFIADWGIIY
jgi:hypothetical protein